MRTDSRLSRMLHVLLHMARDDQPVTSERIAQMLGTNPAVVRRTMGGLREAGYVRSEKGHGGGWTLDCDLAQVTLLDVYRAVGSERLFAMGFDNVHPDCLVEKVVNDALQDAMEQATAILLERLGAVSLADLAERFTALYPKDH
ncbi:Rrf2 family transcriptional regulator [Pseudomonas sp. LABIM340]|uniref:Rrf2 family transcriptional regulator n=2 Tax=Pseudomonadaceae TaxID=135621 RepID=A0A5R8ZTF0_PSENT|nr:MULTISPECIES: Rrf2 family transcriptional regulator [Pseudomonadaceae]OQR27445.1 transcriptional regulator [Pseudomonas sp. T]MBD9516859.1 Rrf2 family transcriptional regulator [Pseudomonas sp. PDM22]MBD9629286.1 Rrf2 family transcriptional regulator [Pseudomonas sp. PDM19]MBD9684453.1 Rrf2 family transcriptional regulator [Pseudomonas sp. PDM20]QEY71438.1 Rrf2 family transcriptional regulator [Pseudomonas denitrificans (nom. rej.)]